MSVDDYIHELIIRITAGDTKAVTEATEIINTAARLCGMDMYTEDQETSLWKRLEPLILALARD